MSALVDVNDNSEIMDYFQRCLDNMYQLIKDNNLRDPFLSIDTTSQKFKETGFMFSNEPVIREIERLTDSDGHSGASFGCCCRNVYHRLMKERKQQWLIPNQQNGQIFLIILQRKKETNH